MFYVDTNILVSALTPEPAQVQARDWLVQNQSVAYVSDWVVTEFASALSVKARFAGLNSTDCARAQAGFTTYIERSGHVLSVSRDHFRAAARWCEDPTRALRAGDALHLAIAAGSQLTVMTRDRGLVKSAADLGLGAQLLEDVS